MKKSAILPEKNLHVNRVLERKKPQQLKWFRKSKKKKKKKISQIIVIPND